MSIPGSCFTSPLTQGFVWAMKYNWRRANKGQRAVGCRCFQPAHIEVISLDDDD